MVTICIILFSICGLACVVIGVSCCMLSSRISRMEEQQAGRLQE